MVNDIDTARIALNDITFDVRTMATADLVTRVALQTVGGNTDPAEAFALALELRVGADEAYRLWSDEVDALIAERAAA